MRSSSARARVLRGWLPRLGPETRTTIASNGDDNLRSLFASDPDVTVRLAVASHTSDPALLQRLASDPDLSVRSTAFANPHLPAHLRAVAALAADAE